jgi:3',5'-cyclic AMP phosphodiesterase CpdA
MTRLAILADPHFHDIDFDPEGAGRPHSALRTLADSTESTRVFNESGAALRAALDDIVARGIALVVIVGDLTDDGQVFNWRAVNALLDVYRARGLRFFATPGNHDLFAMSGRHHAKRFLRPDGNSLLVASDPAVGADIVTEEMFCPGYSDALPLMRDLGYAPDAADLHWETPFGSDPHWASRIYEAMSPDGGTVAPMVDASYLVEPVDGLWLLSLDANVYRPNDRADVAAGAPRIRDCTDIGWNATLAAKPHLVAWIADVARRARALGKMLIPFSHYPVVDPLNGSGADEQRLLGDTGFVRRMPQPMVAAALGQTGIGVHFSGHWHINNTASHRDAGGHVVNIAVPSLVAFPAAFKIATVTPDNMSIETMPLRHFPGYDAAFSGYAAEGRRTGLDATPMLAGPDYGAFLDAHLHALVRHRYLPQEWPADLARLVPRLSISDLHGLAQREAIDVGMFEPSAPLSADQASLLDLVVDWYAIRKGSDLAEVTPQRLASYRAMIHAYQSRQWPDGSLQARLATLLAILQRYLDRPLSDSFTIDLRTGAIAPSLSEDAPISAIPARAGR